MKNTVREKMLAGEKTIGLDLAELLFLDYILQHFCYQL